MNFDNFLNNVIAKLQKDQDLNLEAKDIQSFSDFEVIKIQKEIDKYNVSYINECLDKGIITEDAAQCLKDIYSDGMETYSIMYKKISQTFSKAYQTNSNQAIRNDDDLDALTSLSVFEEEAAPNEIHSINLNTGEIEKNADGSFKEYHQIGRAHV